MNRFRFLIPLAAVALALIPAAALASTTYHESIAGIETGEPYPATWCQDGSVSPFAGVAGGTLNGTFQIAVCHTSLDPNAEILGGTFVLSSSSATVDGEFAPGGTVSLLNETASGGLCTETYAVSGGLLPAGHFMGTLVHYGTWDGSTCTPFFATIFGRAELET